VEVGFIDREGRETSHRKQKADWSFLSSSPCEVPCRADFVIMAATSGLFKEAAYNSALLIAQKGI
jgi:hypothetical protein